MDVDTAGAARGGEAANRAHSRAVALITGLVVAAVAVALGVALVVARGLTQQLGGEPREAAALASEVAARNLRVAVRLKAGDRSSLMFSRCPPTITRRCSNSPMPSSPRSTTDRAGIARISS